MPSTQLHNDAPAQIEAPVTAHLTGSPGIIAETITCIGCQNMCHAQGMGHNTDSPLNRFEIIC